MIVERIPEIGNLTPREKYILATELWEEIEANEGAIPLDDAVVQLLEQRHQEYLADPAKVVAWSEVKKKMQRR